MFNTEYFFKGGISWGDISGKAIEVKKLSTGYIFDSVGIGLYNLNKHENYFLGLLNSKVASYYLLLLSPTLHFNPGGVSKLPIILNENEQIKRIVNDNILIVKSFWDNNEISNNFIKSPLLNKSVNIKIALNQYCKKISTNKGC